MQKEPTGVHVELKRSTFTVDLFTVNVVTIILVICQQFNAF